VALETKLVGEGKLTGAVWNWRLQPLSEKNLAGYRQLAHLKSGPCQGSFVIWKQKFCVQSQAGRCQHAVNFAASHSSEATSDANGLQPLCASQGQVEGFLVPRCWHDGKVTQSLHAWKVYMAQMD